MKEIFYDYEIVKEGYMGKRTAKIWNLGNKFYIVELATKNIEPDDTKYFKFKELERAKDFCKEWLNTDREDFYWSDNINTFLNIYNKTSAYNIYRRVL